MPATDTLTRRHDVHPHHTEWSVHGPGGAVAFSVHAPETGPQFYGPISLHHTPGTGDQPEALPRVDCHLLPGGTCHGDATFRGGRDLGERWAATGRRDATIYAELEDWYTSRLAH